MKLVDIETNRWTKITYNKSGFRDFDGALDRLTSRQYPGYFASKSWAGQNDYMRTNNEGGMSFEICRVVGELTEHTGDKITVQVSY